MPNSEQTLKSFYATHHTEWVSNFVKGLQSAGLKSYSAVPEKVLMEPVGKSMDLFIQCLTDRTPEVYVNAQRDTFSQRVAAGVDPLDITQGLDVAAKVMDGLLNAALPANEVAAMKQRSERYLLMTRTTLLGLLGQRKRA